MRPYKLFFFLLLFSSSFLSKGQKGGYNYGLLIKDTLLFNHISKTIDTTTYRFNDTTFSLTQKGLSVLRESFLCPTPSLYFWDLNSKCIVKKEITPLPPQLPLLGFKVALDPGHLAGTPEMAEVEGKQIKIKHPYLKDSIFFFEGELTYLTVEKIKDSLTKLGADVFVTRKKGESAFGYTYFDWLNTHFHRDLDSCLKNEIITAELAEKLLEKKIDTTLLANKYIFHKFFKQLDFYQRAKIINQFHPDITVIVHYNVDVANTNWKVTTPANYSMAFVPGAFMNGEVEKQIDFNHFVRLSQTNEINESIIFSNYLLNGLKKHTGVAIIEDFREISYLNNYCIPTNKKGVFSRNLALTRQIKGTLCYIEALYQDNFEESYRLNKTRTPYAPQRITHVANGIIEGITAYLNNQR